MVRKNSLTSSQVILPFIVTAFLLSFKKTPSQLFLGYSGNPFPTQMVLLVKSVCEGSYMV